MKGRLAYLTLQSTREGQAAHAHVWEIIDGLVRRGWSVELFEPSYSRSESLPGTRRRLLEFLKVQAGLWLKGSRRFDILYVRSHFAAFPTALLARALGIPVVQEVNGPYADLFIAWPWTSRFRPFFKWLIRTQLRWADAVITVTPELGEWVKEEAGRQKLVSLIPNGANTDIFYPKAVTQLELPEHYAVFVGALAPWQGIDTIINAVERPEWPSDVQLVIVGEGVEQHQVEAAAARNPAVLYLGRLPYQDVPDIVAGALAGLSPQSNPGGRSDTGLFPLKVFETLACGVPVVVTDFPGQADLVRQYRCGLVVSPEDPRSLAEAVAFLHRNPEQRLEMGRRGRAAVERDHSWDSRATDTEAVLLAIMQGS